MVFKKNLDLKEGFIGGIVGGFIGAIFTFSFSLVGSCCCCIFRFGSPIAAFVAGIGGGLIAAYLLKDNIKTTDDFLLNSGITGGFSGAITGLICTIASMIMPAIKTLFIGIIEVSSSSSEPGFVKMMGGLVFEIILGLTTIILGVIGGILGGIIIGFILKPDTESDKVQKPYQDNKKSQNKEKLQEEIKGNEE